MSIFFMHVYELITWSSQVGLRPPRGSLLVRLATLPSLKTQKDVKLPAIYKEVS